MGGTKNPQWYEPFSMADDGKARPRTFPGGEGERNITRKIYNLVEYFLNGAAA
jgi:hypothetical protein